VGGNHPVATGGQRDWKASQRAPLFHGGEIDPIGVKKCRPTALSRALMGKGKDGGRRNLCGARGLQLGAVWQKQRQGRQMKKRATSLGGGSQVDRAATKGWDCRLGGKTRIKKEKRTGDTQRGKSSGFVKETRGVHIEYGWQREPCEADIARSIQANEGVGT